MVVKMSKKSNILEHRREIIFAYDVTDSNPNGDPDDDNRPRMDADGYNIVTDVRLKRTIRDYWDRTLSGKAGFAVLVKRHVDPDTAYLKTMGGIVVEELGIDEAKLGKDVKYRASVVQKIITEIPAKFIDARCFGAAITLQNASYSHVGPVQFAIGRSLNKPDVKSFTITTTFASDVEKAAGTFGEFHVVDYSLILFHGIASEHTAKDSGMAEGDLLHLYRGLWQGTKMLNTRSKFNHVPRFLISVVSKKDHFQIGGLDRFVKLTVEDGIKKATDALVDITSLVDILKANAGNIERIEILSDTSLRFKCGKEESSDLVSLLAKTGLSVKTLELR